MSPRNTCSNPASLSCAGCIGERLNNWNAQPVADAPDLRFEDWRIYNKGEEEKMQNWRSCLARSVVYWKSWGRIWSPTTAPLVASGEAVPNRVHVNHLHQCNTLKLVFSLLSPSPSQDHKETVEPQISAPLLYVGEAPPKRANIVLLLFVLAESSLFVSLMRGEAGK